VVARRLAFLLGIYSRSWTVPPLSRGSIEVTRNYEEGGQRGGIPERSPSATEADACWVLPASDLDVSDRDGLCPEGHGKSFDSHRSPDWLTHIPKGPSIDRRNISAPTSMRFAEQRDAIDLLNL
jgi:hypothetical protein